MPTGDHSPKDMWDLAQRAFPMEELVAMSPERRRTLLMLVSETLDDGPNPPEPRVEAIREMLEDLEPAASDSLLQNLRASRTPPSETSA
jgi:hypothetical protein